MVADIDHLAEQFEAALRIGEPTERFVIPLRTAPAFPSVNDVLGYHRNLWWPYTSEPSELWDRLAEVSPKSIGASDRLVAALHALRSDDMDLEEFRCRYVFGLAAYRYLAFLKRCAINLRASTGDQGLTAEMLSLIERLTPLKNANLVLQREAEGRTLVMNLLHLGVVLIPTILHRVSSLPQSIVSDGVRSTSEKQFHVAATSPSASMQFMKLIKAARASPRAITIAPDGAKGDCRTIDVLGLPMRIGEGADLIVRKTNSAVFFARSLWSGNTFDIEITEGHRDEDFYMAYTENIAKTLLGPPENIGAPIFWKAIIDWHESR